jgi:hypothetical protein
MLVLRYVQVYVVACRTRQQNENGVQLCQLACVAIERGKIRWRDTKQGYEMKGKRRRKKKDRHSESRPCVLLGGV